MAMGCLAREAGASAAAGEIRATLADRRSAASARRVVGEVVTRIWEVTTPQGVETHA